MSRIGRVHRDAGMTSGVRPGVVADKVSVRHESGDRRRDYHRKYRPETVAPWLLTAARREEPRLRRELEEALRVADHNRYAEATNTSHRKRGNPTRIELISGARNPRDVLADLRIVEAWLRDGLPTWEDIDAHIDETEFAGVADGAA